MFSKANLTLIENDFTNISTSDLGLESYSLVISIAVFEQVSNFDAKTDRLHAFAIARTEFRPPNAKEFEIAASIFFSRVRFGT